MKKQFTVRPLFRPLLIGLLLCFSCSREDPDEGVPARVEPRPGFNRELTADVARLWYRAAHPDVLFSTEGEETRTFGESLWLVPDLDAGQEWSDGKIEVVEFPVFGPNPLLVLDADTYRLFESGEEFTAATVMRLVVRKDLETGAVDCFYMEIFGSLEYIRSGGVIGENNYLYRSPDLDGTVLYYDLDGGYVHGWRYTAGEPTHYMAPFEGEPEEAAVNTRYTFCYQQPTYGVRNECINSQEWDPEYEWVLTVTCWKTHFVQWHTVCEEGSGGSGGGGNGGGSSGGYTPPAGTPPPKAEDILNLAGLTPDQRQQIAEMIEYFNDDCMTENLLRGLAEKLNGKKFTVKVGQNNGFDVTTSTITLDGSGERDKLLHELSHGYQLYGETMESFAKAQLNLEMEAHFIQYLYVKRQPEYQPGHKWYDRYNSNAFGNATNELDRCISPYGTLYPDVPSTTYRTILYDYKLSLLKYLEYANYSYDGTRRDDFLNLQKITEGC